MSFNAPQIKSTGSILFEAILVFFGLAIFPAGFLIYMGINFVASQFLGLENSPAPLIGTVVIAFLGSVYTIIDGLNKNFLVLKKRNLTS